MAHERRNDGLSLGSSGAIIECLDEYVVKRDTVNPTRMQDQYVMMAKIGTRAFPRVYAAGHAYYVMEKLEPLQWTEERVAGGIIFEMRDLLPVIWGSYHMRLLGEVMPVMHDEYMRSRWGPLYKRMKKWKDDMLDLQVHVCDNIHGDPTVENVMQRGDQLLFIDPIPANHYIPSIMAVDLGKMLQSIFGYEKKARPSMPTLDVEDPMRLARDLLSSFTLSDEHVSHYFLCVHIARLIPYQTEDRRYIFWDMLADAMEVYS